MNMKKLFITVPKDSLVNSYLMNLSYVFDKFWQVEDMVCYKQSCLFNPMETINLLISKFMLSDFSIECNYGDYIFRVKS